MTLIIEEAKKIYMYEYWSTENAWISILANADANTKKKLKAKTREAKEILDNWVWSLRSRKLRYLFGNDWNIANRRYYLTFKEAAIALLNETLALENYMRESAKAALLLGKDGAGGDGLPNSIKSSLKTILKFVDSNHLLKKECTSKLGAYSGYYTDAFGYSDYGSRTVYKALKNTAESHTPPKVSLAISIIHDVSVHGKKIGLKKDGQTLNAEEMSVSYLDGSDQPNVGKLNVISQDHGGRWTRVSEKGGWVDDRTPIEDHPAIKLARQNNNAVQMGPSRTTLHFLNLCENAGCSKEEMKDLTLGLFAFWNQIYDKHCTMIHCYYFTTDCAKQNFGIDFD